MELNKEYDLAMLYWVFMNFAVVKKLGDEVKLTIIKTKFYLSDKEQRMVSYGN